MSSVQFRLSGSKRFRPQLRYHSQAEESSRQRLCGRTQCSRRSRRPWRVDPRNFLLWPQYRRATWPGIHVLLWFRVPAEGRVTLPFGDSRNKQTSVRSPYKADSVRSEVNGRAVRGDRTSYRRRCTVTHINCFKYSVTYYEYYTHCACSYTLSFVRSEQNS